MKNENTPKKPYQSPKLKELGKIGEVTNAGQTGPNSDNNGGYSS